MIVITGASGKLGRLVVEKLQTKVDKSEIVATARSVEKLDDVAAQGIAVRHLDYNQPETIEAALAGAKQVLLISSSEFGNRAEQHGAVIKAAEAAGVEHLAYTSVLRADTNPMMVAVEHRATEQILDQSPLTTTVLRNGWYIENYTENLGPALEHGVLIGSAGEGRIAAASRADYAAAAAEALANSQLWGGTFELAGSAFTMDELAAKVSAATGREIPYADMPAPDYKGALVSAGLPDEMADFFVDTDLGIAKGELDASAAKLTELVGGPLATVEEVLGSVASE